MNSFSARIFKIGINPYVFVPAKILKQLFEEAKKDRGAIPILVKLEGSQFTQTLVKYAGKWRLYLNGPMRKAAGKDVGEIVKVEIEFDPAERKTGMPEKLRSALDKNKKAMKIFSGLPPSRQKEIMRYIGNLKNEESIDKNVKRAIRFLTGKERFVGRDKP